MVTGRVSIIVPSRNERFLIPTVRDLLVKANGDIEIVVLLEGYWPDPPLPTDPRIKTVHFGTAQGMRPAINAAVHVTTGEYLLKADAHTMWADGFDEVLKANYHEDNWIVVPRRYALEPLQWVIDEENRKYPIDYHYLSEPFVRHGDSTPGLHGSAWTQRRDERAHLELDDELTSQGSAWFMSRRHWDWLGPLEAAKYGVFWHEFQELGLKTWMGGGAVKVLKKTWYAHLYKGKRFGRGYSTAGMGHEDGTSFCSWFWMTDQPFPGKVRTMQSLIEQFAPIPTWPSDLDATFARARLELSDPYARATSSVTSQPTQERLMKFKVHAAHYGISRNDKEFVDVTDAVREHVTAAGLRIDKISNDGLGAGPVFPGQRKRLWVDYSVDGAKATGDALERKSLVLPPAASPKA